MLLFLKENIFLEFIQHEKSNKMKSLLLIICQSLMTMKSTKSQSVFVAVLRVGDVILGTKIKFILTWMKYFLKKSNR